MFPYCVCAGRGGVSLLWEMSPYCVYVGYMLDIPFFLSCYRYREYSFSQLWEALIFFWRLHCLLGLFIKSIWEIDVNFHTVAFCLLHQTKGHVSCLLGQMCPLL